MRIALIAAALWSSAAVAQRQPPPAPGAPAGARRQAGDDGQLVVDVTGGRRAALPIAVPYMPTPQAADTAAGNTGALGHQVAEIVAADLQQFGIVHADRAERPPRVSFPQVTAPDYGAFAPPARRISSRASSRPMATARSPSAATSTTSPRIASWPARAMSCSRATGAAPPIAAPTPIFSRLTGEGGYFDTRVVYVSETGPARHRIKRLAIMDYDGANHRFLTNGQWTVLTPRFAPNQQTITFMTYENERPRVMVYELDSGAPAPLVTGPYMTFAPRYSPDSRYIIFSMAVNGNTDIYRIPVARRHAAAADQSRRASTPAAPIRPTATGSSSKAIAAAPSRST